MYFVNWQKIYFFRLPQDVYQTAKISKLLILMDKGYGHKYKGKSLNEININPDKELAESDNSAEQELEDTSEILQSTENYEESSTAGNKKCKSKTFVKKTCSPRLNHIFLCFKKLGVSFHNFFVFLLFML